MSLRFFAGSVSVILVATISDISESWAQSVRPTGASPVISQPVVYSQVLPATSTLADQVRSAAENLQPDSLPDRQSASEAFLRAAEEVESFFRRGTDESNYQQWMEYLHLKPLRESIEQDGSPSQQGRAAIALKERLTGWAAGLELETLVRLRRSVSEVVAANRFANSERSVRLLRRELNDLADTLEGIDGIPTTEELAAINATVGLLQESNQLPELRAWVRGAYTRPNLVLHVPESTIRSAIQRNVDQSQGVNDCILGTRLFGTANLRGQVNADLLPAVGQVRLALNLRGQFSSRNRGYNGPVKLLTESQGNVFVSRVAHLSESGVHLQPASANVALHSQITSIQHPLRIVRRIARKRAAKQKSQADAIATAKLRRQVREQFVEETNQATSMSMPDWMSKVRPWLRRLDLAEPARTIGSTHDAMFVRGVLADSDQLAAPNSPPAVRQNVVAALQLHESVIENTVSPILAGRTLDTTMINQLRTAAGLVPGADELIGEVEREPFEIQFSRFRPIIFESRDQQVRVGVRGSRFASGNRELDRPVQIVATYVPARMEDGRMVLLKSGDIDVSFPGGRRLSLSQSAIKTTVKQSFEGVFPETLLTKGLAVPQSTRLAAFRGQVYRSRYLDAADGWLTIGAR